MIELILSALLSFFTFPQTETAKVKPCVFPNRCGASGLVAKVKPCVFPNRCGSSGQAVDLLNG